MKDLYPILDFVVFNLFFLLNQKETKNQESLMLQPSRPTLAR
jgi:hypothetical protein